jgi:hypothetical protein
MHTVNQRYKFKTTVQTEYSIRFKDGKLIFFQSGQFISLNSPIILQNGIIISTDGTIRFSDGSVKTLRDGDSFENL